MHPEAVDDHEATQTLGVVDGIGEEVFIPLGPPFPVGVQEHRLDELDEAAASLVDLGGKSKEHAFRSHAKFFFFKKKT